MAAGPRPSSTQMDSPAAESHAPSETSSWPARDAPVVAAGAERVVIGRDLVDLDGAFESLITDA